MLLILPFVLHVLQTHGYVSQVHTGSTIAIVLMINR